MEAPNDLLIGPDGRLWVTDTRAEIDFFAPDESMRGWVWAVDIDSGAKELMLDLLTRFDASGPQQIAQPFGEPLAHHRHTRADGVDA